MPEIASFNGCREVIKLEFVERESTPQLLRVLNIQLHLTGSVEIP